MVKCPLLGAVCGRKRGEGGFGLTRQLGRAKPQMKTQPDATNQAALGPAPNDYREGSDDDDSA